mmetsp:Transcript_39497/g.112783  ORF Transcript_39497/g.112783 Transcript_39497/m.112783 type:complete len:424 (+) Transcript_39497:70-1341(+)
MLAGRCRALLAPLGRRGAAGPSASVKLRGRDSVEVNWRDGKAAQLHPMWLRERCQSKATVDLSTLQPKYGPHELPEELLLDDAEVILEGSALQVSFSDGHVSAFPLARLRRELEGFADAPLQVPEYKRPDPKLWSGQDYKLPVFDHAEMASGEAGRLALIEELLTGGQALVRGVPRDEGEVVRFGRLLSTLRETDWGACFNVRTKPDPSAAGRSLQDLAYTPRPIGFHTDNPYRFLTPDFQLLHAIDHCTCHGAAPCAECSVMNYMVDGFYVAERLRREDPEAFELLSTIPVRFENNGGDNSSALVHVAPHFDLEDGPGAGAGKLRAIRFSSKSGQYAPPLDPVTMSAFYRARRSFSEMLHGLEHSISLQLAPGDLLVFDNQRILHARSQIAPTDGERWLQGCYMDRDGLWSNYERWRRTVGQ